MLRHVVLMKFRDGVTEEEIVEVEKALGALPERIGEILDYEFGRDILRSDRSFDFALISRFDDLPAMKRYQVHPDHQKVSEKLKAICTSVQIVDYDI